MGERRGTRNSTQSGRPWPAGSATALTLLLTFAPYGVALLLAFFVNPWSFLALTGMAAATPFTAAANQRLVRFMLTGEIQDVDRRQRVPNPQETR